MADKYEGMGNRQYMKIEFALPNELKTVEEYRQIIDAFIEKHLSNHYYAYAIHEKIGVLSQKDAINAYDEMVSSIKSKIGYLLISSTSLKKEYEKNLALQYNYKYKNISPLRAVSMAKNIFVKGDLKKFSKIQSGQLRINLIFYRKNCCNYIFLWL